MQCTAPTHAANRDAYWDLLAVAPPFQRSTPVTIQPPADGRSFEIARREIKSLVEQLCDKNICGCCTARALAFYGAFLAEQVVGSAEAIEMLDDLIVVMHKHDIPAPDPMPSTETH